VVKVVNVKIVKERSMKRKGFTLVELLVVIAIIALLMAILVPALAKAKALAYRMLCGSNLAGIGKAMALYSQDQDHDGDYPVAGGQDASWSALGGVNAIGWLKGWSETKTFGTPPDNKATITSCLYLLIRYQMAQPKQFVCRGDEAVIFKLSLFKIAPSSMFITWDFGDGAQVWPGECCSYSYQMPFSVPDMRPGRDGMMTTFMPRERSPEDMPVCADRNPFIDEHFAAAIPDIEDNCFAHGREGQNVLYKDGHVSFEKTPLVGIGQDNIWCWWDGSADQPPQFVGDDGPPFDKRDAYLVNEYQQGTFP
jgi:prepilin-type N-terminal cleavage/methylation domain-containing protein